MASRRSPQTAARRPPPPPPPERGLFAHVGAALALLAAIGGGWWLVSRDSSSVALPDSPPLTVVVDDTVADSAGDNSTATELPLDTSPATDVDVGAAVVADSAPTEPSEAQSEQSAPSDSSVPTNFDISRVSAPENDLQTGAPAVSAEAYLVYDAATNRIIAAKQADAPRAVGSVIKLLTTMVVLQAGPLDDPVTVPKLKLDPKESQIGLRAGEKLTRAILMRAMLIVSANDAARALAIDTAGSEERFVEQMNEMAGALGLHDTVAKSPVGLDAAGAHSTASDVLTLARYVMGNEDVRAAVARRTAKLHGTTYAATNKLLGSVAGADGIKTGHTTDAGYCIVASATRNGRQVIVVVLGSPTEAARTKTAKALINWGFAQ